MCWRGGGQNNYKGPAGQQVVVGVALRRQRRSSGGSGGGACCRRQQEEEPRVALLGCRLLLTTAAGRGQHRWPACYYAPTTYERSESSDTIVSCACAAQRRTL